MATKPSRGAEFSALLASLPAPAAPPAALPWADDEFHGHGGSFLYDPKTGKRTRVVDPGAAPDPQPADKSAPQTKE